MNTISDLRQSLEETAHRYDAPDPHELLRGVQDDIATGRDTDHHRPRLVAAAAALALVAGGGWALSQRLSEDETGTLHPASPWELVDGAPPEYAAGLALVDTVTLGPDSRDEQLTWSADGQGYAVAWCDVDPQTAPLVVVALSAGQGEGSSVGCLSGSVDATDGPTSVPALAQTIEAKSIKGEGLAGGLAEGESITVGLYREASISEYPYPDLQEPPEPPTADVVLDASSPKADQSDLADLTGQGGMLSTATVESREGAVLTTWAGEPGRLLVAVNGTVITNDGEELTQPTAAGPWQDADPDLRGGYWHTWTAGASTREFDLSPAGLATHGIQVSEGDTVTVVAHGTFPRDAWQIGIDQPEDSQDAAETGELATVEPTATLPALAYGYEQVVAVSVPADGVTRELDLAGLDQGNEVLWVAQCPDSMGSGEVRLGLDGMQCTRGLEWLSTRPDVWTGEPVSVSAGVGSDSATLAAYVPRAWDGYPFGESANPLADGPTVELVRPRPIHGGAPPTWHPHWTTEGPNAVYSELGTIGPDDLDTDGRAQLTVPSASDLSIWVQSEGVARVRVEVDGIPLSQLENDAGPLLGADGWYSTWSAAPFGYEIRLDGGTPGQAPRTRESTVSIEVDARDSAEIELTFFEFMLAEDFEG